MPASMRLSGQPVFIPRLPRLTPSMLRPEVAERIRVTPSGCWRYDGATGDGYRFLNHFGPMERAHRHVRHALVGPLPPSMMLDHLCKDRACCCPDHLEPATAAVNNRRGLRATLTERTVRLIRAMHAAGFVGRGPDRLSQREVGEAFGVTGAAVSRVIDGKLWAGLN